MVFALGAGVAGGVMLAVQARAQPTDADLKALIPDAAVANPADWAKGNAAPAPAPAPPPPHPASPAPPPPLAIDAAPSDTLNPASPLPVISGMDLPWPDEQFELPPLRAAAAGTPQAVAPSGLVDAALAPIQPGDDRHDRLAGGRVVLAWAAASGAVPERGAILARFRLLSVLQNLPAKERDATAQLAVRAAADRAMLERLLTIYGYQDAEVTETLTVGPVDTAAANGEAAAQVAFSIVPGGRYRFGVLSLPGLEAAGDDAAGLRTSFGLHAGDPLYADAIVAGTTRLSGALAEAGYPFAEVGAPLLTVDHARESGALDVPVTPKAKVRIGRIISSLPRFLSSRHLAEIARFKPGSIYRQSLIDDLNRAIVATGLVSSVRITPQLVSAPAAAPRPAPGAAAPSPTPVDADLAIALTPAPLRTVSAAVGYDTAEGTRLELDWEHHNLFPPEGDLLLRGVAGTNQQLAGATLRRNNFMGRDRVLSLDLYAQNANLTAYSARQVVFVANFERLSTLIFQKPWSWSVGAEAAASDEREGEPAGTALVTGAPQPQRALYVTGALPLRAAYDGSDSLLDPSHGWRAALRISPEVVFSGGKTSAYVKLEGNASAYLPLARGVTFASRVRLGSIFGTDLTNIAPSRRFYAGGGGSIRGFGYDLVGPRTTAGAIEGGRSVFEASGELRFHTGLLGGALSLAPFFDSGTVNTLSRPDFSGMRYGAGMGLRYASSIGPIRLDLGTPLNPQPGDSRIGVYISLGQAF